MEYIILKVFNFLLPACLQSVTNVLIHSKKLMYNLFYMFIPLKDGSQMKTAVWFVTILKDISIISKNPENNAKKYPALRTWRISIFRMKNWDNFFYLDQTYKSLSNRTNNGNQPTMSGWLHTSQWKLYDHIQNK